MFMYRAPEIHLFYAVESLSNKHNLNLSEKKRKACKKKVYLKDFGL